MKRHIQAALYFIHFVVWLYAAPLLAQKLGLLNDALLLRLVKRMARTTFELFGVSLQIHNQHVIPPKQGKIYIANHRSWLDQPAVILAAPDLLHFLGKKDYFDMPVLKTTLKLFRCVPVDKNQPGQTVERMKAVLAAGGSLVFYPEGTRSTTDDFLPFRSGAFVLSAQTQAPIVPLYIHGAHDVLPRAKSLSQIQPGTIHVEVGEPYTVPASFLDKMDLQTYESRFIDAHIQSRQRHQP